MIKIQEMVFAKKLIDLGIDVKKHQKFIKMICEEARKDVFAVCSYMAEIQNGVNL